MTDGPRVRVLQSFPTPRPTTNPYVVMLADALRATSSIDVLTFSWRAALTARYDVFHVHWPEILVSGHSPAKKAVRQLLFVLLVLRLWLLRRPVVRTLHNLELPTGISRREVVLLRWLERRTTLWIVLNPFSGLSPDTAQELIPHGHYRPWFAEYPPPAAEPGRLAFFGLVRRYKGVDALIQAMRDTPREGLVTALQIAGKPSTDGLARELTELAAPDPRIELDLQFLTDEQLVTVVGRAQLVVLPAPLMHNSGGVLTALSLDRPVLVIDNAANRLLREEVGPSWVFLYTGTLSAADLEAATAATAARPAGPRPELSARDWDRSAHLHLQAYQRALADRRR